MTQPAGVTEASRSGPVLQACSHPPRLPREAGEMVRAWQHGDAAWFETEIKQEFGRDPALYRTMLTGRNRKWLPRIEALLNADRNYLIIVGTGHLVGRDGVVDLLKRDGIQAIQR